MTLPDFIIAGGQKCGTTAAARNLSLHPKVNVFRGLTRAGQKNEIEYFNQHWDKGVDWYISHFDTVGTDVIQGEKTAELLHRTVCHERMALTNPAFKIVVVLRCPVERAYSQWRMAALHKGDEPDDFASVVERELKFIEDIGYRSRYYGCQNSDLSCWREGYLIKGMYAEQLESLYEWFPKHQVFVTFAERIRSNMVEGYSPVFEFLGVDPLRGEFAEHFVGKPAPSMSTRTRSLLLDLYRLPNQRLCSLLGQDIPEWQ